MNIPHEMLTFVRVVEDGSFAAAAANLDLSPSAVSKIVSRLERRLATKLLTRTTRRLTLTAEGQVYVARAREIIAAIDAAESAVRQSANELQGHLRISTGTAVGRKRLVTLVPQFLSAHSGITVDLIVSDHRIDLIEENVDVAVRAGDLPDSTNTARKIATAKRVICASPGYLETHGRPSTPLDLRSHSCIVIDGFPHLARWPFHISEGVSRVQVGGALTTDNADVMLDLAISGHGIVRMVDLHVSDAIRHGQLVALFADEQVDDAIPIWAMSPPDRNQLPRVRAFIDFLVEYFAEDN